jgi:hypothetical protein
MVIVQAEIGICSAVIISSNRVHCKPVNWPLLLRGGYDSCFFVFFRITFASLLSFFLKERLAKQKGTKRGRLKGANENGD